MVQHLLLFQTYVQFTAPIWQLITVSPAGEGLTVSDICGQQAHTWYTQAKHSYTESKNEKEMKQIKS